MGLLTLGYAFLKSNRTILVSFSLMRSPTQVWSFSSSSWRSESRLLLIDSVETQLDSGPILPPSLPSPVVSLPLFLQVLGSWKATGRFYGSYFVSSAPFLNRESMLPDFIVSSHFHARSSYIPLITSYILLSIVGVASLMYLKREQSFLKAPSRIS